MATRYKYKLLLWQHEEYVGKRIGIISDTIEFFTPVQTGERIILPSHVKAIAATPQWARDVIEWEVLVVTHQIQGAVDEVDFAELVPAQMPHFPERVMPIRKQLKT